MVSPERTLNAKERFRQLLAAGLLGASAMSLLSACNNSEISAVPQSIAPSPESPTPTTTPETSSPSASATPSVSEIPTTEYKEFEVVPLREWNIDATLFEGWDELSDEEKKERGTTFFDTNIVDESYHSRSLDTGIASNTIESSTYDIFAELRVISDLYLDETVEDGTGMASDLLDVITRKVGSEDKAKQQILDDLAATREIMFADDCTWGDCFELRKKNEFDQIIKASSEMYSATDTAGEAFVGHAATVGTVYHSTPYSPSTSIITVVIDMSKGKKLVSFGNEIFNHTASYDASDPEVVIAEIDEVKKYIASKS